MLQWVAIFRKNFDKDELKDLYDIIKRYIHPISYKVLGWKNGKKDKSGISKILQKNRIVEDFMIVESSKNLDCFDLARTSKNFQTKVYGVKVSIHNSDEGKTLIICGLVDDLVISCTNFSYMKNKICSLYSEVPKDPEFKTENFDRFIKTLTIKELLIYKNQELYQRFIGYINQANLMKQKSISQNVKEFINSDLYGQRRVLIQLLMKYNDPEFQYLAYLLYDLLSNESNGSIDTLEQTILFDSLPWNIKKYFRDAMKTTIKYTNNLSQFDNNNIPIEQQICLLKAPDNVKEKAMVKLKEVKAKSEDSGSKARQYLDGILKIPFGIYRSESILSNMKDIKKIFIQTVKMIYSNNIPCKIPNKQHYSSLEISKHINYLHNEFIPLLNNQDHELMIKYFCKGKRDTLIANICYINGITKKIGYKKKLCHSGKKNNYMKEHIKDFILAHKDNDTIVIELKKRFPKIFKTPITNTLTTDLENINKQWISVSSSISNIKDQLENAVHGHENAKRQIERIIGEWMNGKQTGYCFGFEGPPGVGKTSLAKKGLAQCLKDQSGICRPFSFIAVGGSSNGSTLEGHNYTYVGSTWGRIADIIMETKCMNPIILLMS